MEQIAIIREKFQLAQKKMRETSDSETSYWLGVAIRLVDAVSIIRGISWIEADVLLRKES